MFVCMYVCMLAMRIWLVYSFYLHAEYVISTAQISRPCTHMRCDLWFNNWWSDVCFLLMSDVFIDVLMFVQQLTDTSWSSMLISLFNYLCVWIGHLMIMYYLVCLFFGYASLTFWLVNMFVTIAIIWKNTLTHC